MEELSNSPLVSVIVITYKSAKTVIDTLESVYSQTYPEIELIISDDGSTDDTIDVCEKWLASHKGRFVRAKLIKAPRNTGTSGNCNRGCEAATGEWLKIVAGDDTLLNSCVKDLIDFVQLNNKAMIVCGSVSLFGAEVNDEYRLFWTHNLRIHKILETAEEQYWYLLRRNFIPAMAVMMKKSLWKQLNGFDEDVPLIEDWPMWLRVTEGGNKIYFTEKQVANYRITGGSVRSNYNFAYSILLCQYKYIYKREKDFVRLKRMTFLKKRTLLSMLVHKYLSYKKNKYRLHW